MTRVAGEIRGDARDQEVGRRYRFERLALGLVLSDMSFDKDDPGPGDRVPDFDLPMLGGGRFRSTDLGETAPVLLSRVRVAGLDKLTYKPRNSFRLRASGATSITRGGRRRVPRDPSGPPGTP